MKFAQLLLKPLRNLVIGYKAVNHTIEYKVIDTRSRAETDNHEIMNQSPGKVRPSLEDTSQSPHRDPLRQLQLAASCAVCYRELS